MPGVCVNAQYRELSFVTYYSDDRDIYMYVDATTYIYR